MTFTNLLKECESKGYNYIRHQAGNGFSITINGKKYTGFFYGTKYKELINIRGNNGRLYSSINRMLKYDR